MSNPAVFISYSHSDEETDWVRKFARALEGQGISVWLDAERLDGDDAAEEALETGLRNSVALVTIIDPKHLDRPDLYFEIGAALGMGKRIIPVAPSSADTSTLPHPLRARPILIRRSPEETAKSVALAVSEKASGRERLRD